MLSRLFVLIARTTYLSIVLLAIAGLSLELTVTPASASNGRKLGTTGETQTPQARTDVSSGLSAALGPARFARIQTLVPDADSQCLPLTQSPPKALHHHNEELLGLLSRIEASSMGAWLIAQAERRGILLCLDRHTEFRGYFRSQARLIGLQESLSASAKIVFLAHELSHVIQHPRYSNNRYFSPKDMALIQRHREAVAEAFATCILAQMKQSGDNGPWEAKKQTQYADIQAAYERELAAIPPKTAETWSDRELRAMRAAFKQWFRTPWRLNFYDGLMLDHLERVARDAIGLLPIRRIADDTFLRGIAWHNGKNFLSESEDDLAEMPYAAAFSSENRARLDRVLASAAIRAHLGPIP